jgi:hypothetical protein
MLAAMQRFAVGHCTSPTVSTVGAGVRADHVPYESCADPPLPTAMQSPGAPQAMSNAASIRCPFGPYLLTFD